MTFLCFIVFKKNVFWHLETDPDENGQNKMCNAKSMYTKKEEKLRHAEKSK
jgi:hypothetical protein